MKRAYIIVFLVCAVLFVSCKQNSSPEVPAEEPQTNVTVLSDSIKECLIKQDSLNAELIGKLDTLTDELNASKAKVTALQRQVDDLENPRKTWNYLTIAAFILALIAIVLYVLKLKDFEEIRTRIDHHKDEITKLWNQVNSPKSNKSNSSYMPQNTKGMEQRIEALETSIGKIRADINSAKISEPPSHGATEPDRENGNSRENSYAKDLYAKLNTGKYFMSILPSNQDGCVFHIKCRNQRTGEFDIIELRKIQSSNDWQDAIEIVAESCLMADATGYKLIDRGICELLPDESGWKVKEKLKIKLTK